MVENGISVNKYVTTGMNTVGLKAHFNAELLFVYNIVFFPLKPFKLVICRAFSFHYFIIFCSCTETLPIIFTHC